MTTTITVPSTHTADQLRRVLRADAVVTGAVGLLGLLGPAWYGDPSWVARAVGAVLVLVAADVALAARWSGRRLVLAGTVVAEAAFAWVVAATAVAFLVEMPTAGREVLLLSAVVTLGFAIVETRLVRALR